MLRQNRLIIDLETIRNNFRILRQNVPPDVAVMAVVKANAYGHGMLETAHALSEAGVRHFAVALAEEGIALRLSGIKGEILVLGAAMPRTAQASVEYDLAQTVFTPEMVYLLEKEAVRQGKSALVHIKLDTGMNRIGLRTAEEAQAVAQALKECPHVKAMGIYTHFADADSPMPNGALNEFSQKQLECFRKLRTCFDPWIPSHVANSAMSLLAPQAFFSMIREGIALYGYPPVETELHLKPALEWVTEVVHVKTVRAGECIGYGCSYTAEKDMRIATVAVGYGDGYHRACSNRGAMLIRGKRAPIVGRVCMDQTMVDVTNIPGVCAGDDAVILGSQGSETITAEEIASWADTISYEVLLSVSPRVERIYQHIK